MLFGFYNLLFAVGIIQTESDKDWLLIVGMEYEEFLLFSAWFFGKDNAIHYFINRVALLAD